jgi:hypothetical protein
MLSAKQKPENETTRKIEIIVTNPSGLKPG